MKREMEVAAVPLKWVGPIRIKGSEVEGDTEVPLATYESPLWPSVDRGARVTREIGGITVVVLDQCMTRSVVVEAADAASAAGIAEAIRSRMSEMEAAAAATSRFARLRGVHCQVVGRQLYVRFSFDTGDAAGHNMATKAAESLLDWILREYPALKYVSISGNLCTDKKPSAVNGILGRGVYVIAEGLVPARICETRLRVAPQSIVDLNMKKNWMGTALAGGLRAANAHFANMLLAFYLATGQDAANIVEGSQGFVTAEVQADGSLYFACTIPHIIVGTVGSGKDLPFVERALERLGCRANRPAGENRKRLAAICGAVVWCGELSLLAAQANPGELVRAHMALERKARAHTG
ncbi:MAG: hydroxymethylglutaryl-CoA reductase [Kiritimatiellae bacterium]|nr:hydroxymethylglutaryl-CoA reductase [Kiritimatiellia bacterium]MDW8458122.1 hydroxymethylglutaryl-CoA reductase [Verrucomicrobiota bacterium]